MKMYLIQAGDAKLAVAKVKTDRHSPLENDGAQEWSDEQEYNPHPGAKEGVLFPSSKVTGNSTC